MSEPISTETPALPAPTGNRRWYVIKVQSGREDTIKDAIERRVKIEGLEEYFGQIIVPVERTMELVKGRKVTRTRKLYPGYIMAEVEFNDRILYLFRETPGVGDFVTGGGVKTPIPMSETEVSKIMNQKKEVIEQETPVAPKIDFHRGDHIKVKDGMFAGMEGEVNEILESKGLVRVMLKIFGRDVPVELEYWQIEHV